MVRPAWVTAHLLDLHFPDVQQISYSIKEKKKVSIVDRVHTKVEMEASSIISLTNRLGSLPKTAFMAQMGFANSLHLKLLKSREAGTASYRVLLLLNSRPQHHSALSLDSSEQVQLPVTFKDQGLDWVPAE